MSNDERYLEGSDFGSGCICRDGGRWMSQEDATVSFPHPVRVKPGITGMPDEPPSRDLRFAEIGQRPNSAMCFARSMIAMPDGRLLAAMYGVWEGEAARRSVVVQSTDEGKTWTYLSTLCDSPAVEAATGYENQGCEEASLVRLARISVRRE